MLVILSGCSGGGKTTLLEELARRGSVTVAEPGMRIVLEEQESAGGALPWVNPAAFAQRAVEMSRKDLEALGKVNDPVFFDRGLVDAVAALEFATGQDHSASYPEPGLFYEIVFIVPPWPEHFHHSDERRHGFGDALAEYERLLAIYIKLGFKLEILPRAPVDQRADKVLALIGCG